MYCFFFFFQAEDGIRDLVRSRGLGDVYKRQVLLFAVDYFEKRKISFPGIFEKLPFIFVALLFVFLTLHSVSYTHLRAHETVLDLVCRLLLEKKKHTLLII